MEGRGLRLSLNIIKKEESSRGSFLFYDVFATVYLYRLSFGYLLYKFLFCNSSLARMR